jgi:hypothetical protein
MALVHQPPGIHNTAHATQCATFSTVRLLPDLKPKALPVGYPRTQSSDLAWNSSNLTEESKYIYHLSSTDIEDIGMGLESFKCKNSPLQKKH